MFSKQIGNILIGKTLSGKNIKIIQNGEKTVTEIGSTIREKTFKTIPINDDRKIFKTAFPQYNDFRLLIRHEKISRNTKDFGKLLGTTPHGENIIIMRQNKINSEYSDITMNFNSNISVPLNPNEFNSFKSEINPSNNLKTKVYCPFARAYLKGNETLKITENATNEFYKIMKKETCNI